MGACGGWGGAYDNSICHSLPSLILNFWLLKHYYVIILSGIGVIGEGGGTLGHHVVLFALNANFIIIQFCRHNAKFRNEDTTWNIDQIPHSSHLMNIFLDSILSA